MAGQAVGGKYTPVLAPRAAEAHLQVAEPSFDIVFNWNIYDGKYAV